VTKRTDNYALTAQVTGGSNDGQSGAVEVGFKNLGFGFET